MRMLDLFCGRWGWSKAFAARGWECVGVDLVHSSEQQPPNAIFIQADILTLDAEFVGQFDFVCASSPCEQFSVHGMKHFHPNPPYPDMGLKLFNHTREICESAGVPYVMENVRAAQKFVGRSVHHCGPFHLWGNAVPPLMNQGIIKGYSHSREANNLRGRKGHSKAEIAARNAVVPPELANCVVDYAEAILGVRP